MKVILDKEKYNKIWNDITEIFKFNPSSTTPFSFNIKYICYKLNSIWTDEQEKIVNDIFKKIDNCEIYALDYKHDCFEYNPNENIELNYHYHDDNRDCEVYFPSYYPDGDYYFFISKDYKYGLLGHPWRKEIYIFGNNLINEFKNKEKELNITIQ